MLRIGEFSKMAKTTISNIRYYDKIGLLRPEYIDESTGYRYYNESQLADIVRAKNLEENKLGIKLLFVPEFKFLSEEKSRYLHFSLRAERYLSSPMTDGRQVWKNTALPSLAHL